MESKISSPKRLIIARFDEGDDLVLSLKQCATLHNIKAGWLSGIGALKEISFGLYANKAHRSIKREADHCFEIISLSGNISIKEGELLVHAHITVADDKEGCAFGGHLLEGSKVYPFAEVFIQECDADIRRVLDERINLWAMKLKGHS